LCQTIIKIKTRITRTKTTIRTRIKTRITKIRTIIRTIIRSNTKIRKMSCDNKSQLILFLYRKLRSRKEKNNHTAVQFFLKSFSFSKNAHGIRKAKLLRPSAVGGAAKLLFLLQVISPSQTENQYHFPLLLLLQLPCHL